MSRRISNWHWFLDYIIIPSLIIFIVFQRNFMHGFIDYLEEGKELACINELFYGKIPHKDMFTLFGPLNVYLGAFSMLVFGKSLAALRGYFYFGNIITLVTGYFIGRRLCGFRFFAYAIAFALIVETFHPFWATRWGGLRFGFGLAAILCAINFFKEEKNLWAFLSGIFVAVTFLTTMDTGILSLVAISSALCFYVAFNFKKFKTFKLKGITLFFVGILVILVPFVFYFVFKGAFLPYVNMLTAIAKYHLRLCAQGRINLWASLRPTQVFTFNFKYIFLILLYIYSIIYLILSIFKKRLYWKHYCILCLSIYGILMYKTAMRVIQGPQFQMALQPAIILGFIFLEDIFKQILILKQHITIKGNLIKFMALMLIFILMLCFAVFSEKRFYRDLKEWFWYQRRKDHMMPVYGVAIPFPQLRLSTLKIERAKGIVVPLKQAEDIEAVTRYITSITQPNEAIFTFPEQGIFNFFADRPVVGKFPIASLALINKEYQLELIQSLKQKRPKYVILGKRLSNLAMAIDSKEELFPEITKFIKEHYVLLRSFHTIDIYSLK